jgi:undecaprenyl phosphate-alpha-L-ara4FN deformylase
MRQAVGLRIDVDTVGGFARGVVPLVRLLDSLHINATFFIVSGEDSPLSGFARLFSEKGFPHRVLKLRRSICQATFSKGGAGVKESIHAIKESKHELALHGFHHFRWQLQLKEWGVERISREIENGRESFRLLTGAYPPAFAAPGWETSDLFFKALDSFGFSYASDTRGSHPFYPRVDDRCMDTLQIPVTLPTLDEFIALGRTEQLLELRIRDRDVYCGHAEFDGITHLPLFERFLKRGLERGFTFVSLSEIACRTKDAPKHTLDYRIMPGRTRMVTWQKSP